MKTPKKKLANQTLKNRLVNINSFVLKRLQNQECNNIIENLKPNIKEDITGEVFRKIKNNIGPKTDEAYMALSHIVDFKPKSESSFMKNFGVGRGTAKKVLAHNKTKRKVRKKKFSDENFRDVDNFFKRGDISIIDPNVKKSSSKGGPRMHMRFSLKEAYMIFKQDHPYIQMSFSKFYKLKPDNIRCLSSTPLIGCLCFYCANIMLKLVALGDANISAEYHLFNNLVCKREKSQFEYEKDNCKQSNDTNRPVNSEEYIVNYENQTAKDQETDKCDNINGLDIAMTHTNTFRDSKCIYGECEDCWGGPYFEEAILSLVSTKLNEEVVFKSWKNEKYETKAGKPGNRKILTINKGTYAELTKELMEVDIVNSETGFSFVLHYFGQSFQYKQFANCKSNLKDGEAVFTQDYSNNIEAKKQDEIKGGFFSQISITAHPSVLEAKIPGIKENKKIVITHLSDIKVHDAHMVYFITKDCINYLRENFPDVVWEKIYLWSDGCTGQYKGKTSFWYLNQFDIDIERNFFGSEHGKNESDGVTGLLSRLVSDGIKSRRVLINNATDLLTFLTKKKPEYVFKLITEADLEPIRNKFKLEAGNLRVLTGNCTRILHQIKPRKEKVKEYLWRPFSCFCSSCKSDHFEKCENKDFTKGKFTSQILPSNSSNDDDEKEEEETQDAFDNMEDDEDTGMEIKVEQKHIDFDKLEVGKFLIANVPVPGKTKNKQFVAKILDIEDEDHVYVKFFKQEFDAPDVFGNSPIPGDERSAVGLDDIVMFLPEPFEKRSKFFFSGPIVLS